MPYKFARWIDGEPEELKKMQLPYSAKLVKDQLGYYAVLFQTKWDCEHSEKEYPQIRFSPIRVHRPKGAVSKLS
jgi:peptide subunit release factor RF-3